MVLVVATTDQMVMEHAFAGLAGQAQTVTCVLRIIIHRNLDVNTGAIQRSTAVGGAHAYLIQLMDCQ
jgi:hypothetical protein